MRPVAPVGTTAMGPVIMRIHSRSSLSRAPTPIVLLFQMSLFSFLLSWSFVSVPRPCSGLGRPSGLFYRIRHIRSGSQVANNSTVASDIVGTPSPTQHDDDTNNAPVSVSERNEDEKETPTGASVIVGTGSSVLGKMSTKVRTQTRILKEKLLTASTTESGAEGENGNGSKRRRLFLDRIALISEKLLRSDNASIVDEEGSDEDITAQSDLTLPNRQIHIVTTAALPWMTGTSLNPLLRAAYMCKMTKRINGIDAEPTMDGICEAGVFNNTDVTIGASANAGDATTTDVATPKKPRQYVTLVVPWLELEQDRRELYGSQHVFENQAEQETYIRDWMRQQEDLYEEADPETGIRILFYPARYHSGLRSIFAMGDICSLIPEEEADIAVLEEAEHLNWYRAPGDGWTKKFKFVVGVMHTNYKEYAAGHYSGLWTSPAIGVMSSAMVRAYCHKVIKLSDVLQTYAPEKENVSNVHGVRQEFLREGKRRAEATLTKNDKSSSEAAGGCNTYFIGKILWAKGLDRLIDLQEYYKQCTGQYFEIDIFGSGPEEKEIKRAFHGRKSNTKKHLVGSKGRARVFSRGNGSSFFFLSRNSTVEGQSNSNNQSNDQVDRTGEFLVDEESETSDSDSGISTSDESWTRRKLATISKTIKTTAESIEFELPKSRYELLRKQPIPAKFPGRVDHAVLKEQYKVFVNPSVSEVLCTTTAEALAMGKFAIVPVHPSNEFFLKFPNCLAYRNKLEFAANLRWALTHEPEPLTPELAHEFTWEAATERFVKAAAITKKEAHIRAKLGLSKFDERIAYFHNELGKGAKGDALRKVLGGGPVSHQVKYEMEKRREATKEDIEEGEASIDDDAVFGKFEGSWFASVIRSTFGYMQQNGNTKFVGAEESA